MPGLAGSVSGFEREHEAVAAVRLALSELVQGLGPEEIEQVLAAQAEVVPGDLPRGTRLVRVSVEAPSYEVPRAAAGG